MLIRKLITFNYRTNYSREVVIHYEPSENSQNINNSYFAY
jgi:hypothetical protein